MTELTRLELATMNLAAAHKALDDYNKTNPQTLMADIQKADAEFKEAATERAMQDEQARKQKQFMAAQAEKVQSMEEREANALADQRAEDAKPEEDCPECDEALDSEYAAAMADEDGEPDTAPATDELTDPAVSDDGHGGDDGGAEYATDGKAAESMLNEVEADPVIAEAIRSKSDEIEAAGHGKALQDAYDERKAESAEAVAQFSEDPAEAEGDDGAGLVADSEAAVAASVGEGGNEHRGDPVDDAGEAVEDDSGVIDATDEVSQEEAFQAAH